jgi:hypothetical protein
METLNAGPRDFSAVFAAVAGAGRPPAGVERLADSLIPFLL